MLEQLRAVLAPGGRVVVRQALVPAGTVVEDEAWPALRGRHRGGLLDDSELGFGVRLVGHLGCCWDGCRLDNAALFGEVDRQAAAGCWRPRELAAIARYRFDGSTALLAEGDWAAVVAGSGFDLREHPLSGRDWYRYYRVQQLTAV
jgi:hypothetical protein